MRPRRKLTLIVLACGGGLLVLLWPLIARWIDRQHGNVPIVFYGRVVDEDGNGIAGVRVTGTVRRGKWLTPLSVYNIKYDRLPVESMTDEDGRFTFRGRGNKVDLKQWVKEGWQITPAISGSDFSYPPGPDYPPGMRPRPDDPDKPITFVMRPKRQGRQGVGP